MVRLPLEYQEVEYLESTQSQYIDTNYIPNINSEITIVFSDFSFTSNDGDSVYRSPYGYWQNGASIQTSKLNTSTTIYTSFGNKVDVSYSTRYGWKNVIKQVLSKDGVYENDTRMLEAYSSLEFNQASGSIYIFARNSSGVVQRKVKMKLYSFTVSENSELMLNLIPCYRKSDSEPGMYDAVSGTFYTNSGTGTFLVGNDVEWDTASLLERRRQIMSISNYRMDTIPKIAEYGKACNRSGDGLAIDEAYCYTEYYKPEYEGSQTIYDNVTKIDRTYQYLRSNGNSDFWYGPSRTIGLYTKIRFSIPINKIDDAYAYSAKSGQIFFAGKNTPYYGYRNIKYVPN